MRKISTLLIILPFVLAPGLALAQTARCSDGWVSNSTNIHGTCSDHGGVKVWLDKGMKEQANEWCDENPGLCASSHWVGIAGHGNHSQDVCDAYSRRTEPYETMREFAEAARQREEHGCPCDADLHLPRTQPYETIREAAEAVRHGCE